MVKILPFQGTRQLITEIDEFLDKVSEAAMVLDKTLKQYLVAVNEDELDARFVQIREIEARADELRRNVNKMMYTQMLMPDTRGDVLSLGAEVDSILDDCTHRVAGLGMERPEIPAEFAEGFATVMDEASKAIDALIQGARTYFKEPRAVRDHVHKVSFHNHEATTSVLETGRRVFDSDLPLERKRQLRDWLLSLRMLASNADDVADRLVIYAAKRSL